MTLLTACAGMTVIGAGCNAYETIRLLMPEDSVLSQAPRELLEWLLILDNGMLEACKSEGFKLW